MLVLESVTTVQITSTTETVVIPGVPGGTDNTYILELRSGSVSNVTGLGLTWQQKGRLYYASGTSSGGDVTVTLYYDMESPPPSANIAAVLRYSGLASFEVRTAESSDSVAEVYLGDTFSPYTDGGETALLQVKYYGAGVSCTPQTGYTEIMDINLGGSNPLGLALYSAPLTSPISGTIGYLSEDASWEMYVINLIPDTAENYYPTKTFDFSAGAQHWVVPENGPRFMYPPADEQIAEHCSYVEETACGGKVGMWVGRGYYFYSLGYNCYLQIAFPGKVSFTQLTASTGPTNGADNDPVTGIKYVIKLYDSDSIDGPWNAGYGYSGNSKSTSDCATITPYKQVENKIIAIQAQTQDAATQVHWASIVQLDFVDFIDHDGILLEPPEEPTEPEFYYAAPGGALTRRSDMPFKVSTPGSLAVAIGEPNSIAIGSGEDASSMILASADNGASWGPNTDTVQNDVYDYRVNRLLFATGLAPVLVGLRNNEATLTSQMFDSMEINPLRDRGEVPVSRPNADGIDVNPCNKFVCAGGEFGVNQVAVGNPDEGWVDYTGLYTSENIQVIRWSD